MKADHGWRENMEQLEKYCIEVRQINGKMTYIVSPKLFDEIQLDEDLLASLYASLNRIRHQIEEAKANPDRIFFAFVQHSHVKMKRYVWEPVNCYKDGDVYYHVHIRNTWMCRECKQLHHGKFIMPMDESDPIFYSGTDNPYPPVSPVFKKRICANCGKALQNHFI